MVAGAVHDRDLPPRQPGELGVQGWLVGLDDQQVVGAAVDEKAGVVALGVQRIGRDDHTGKVEAGQQWPKQRDLVGVCGHVALGEHGPVVVDGYVASALVHAVAARVAVHQGEVRQAQEQLARATRLRPLLTYALPYFAVQTLLELGRVCLALDDGAGARVVLRQARDVLRRRPDLGILPGQVDELRSKLDSNRGGAVGVSSLTAAELRLLPLLPTRLTFAEIGERLYVSQHTVKTHASSVYRKLGVSSRSQAVQRLQEFGLGG
jgi:DNA-binding CsgD family transcriptional regulator